MQKRKSDNQSKSESKRQKTAATRSEETKASGRPTKAKASKSDEPKKPLRVRKQEEFDRNAREDPNHVFHDLYVCRGKGPDGSPTYDQAGFELDYDKVMDWFKPHPIRKPTLKQSERMHERFKQKHKDEKEMGRLFYKNGAAPEDSIKRPSCAPDAWKEKVGKDLGVLWHEIDLDDFREWDRQGFPKAGKGEYEKFTDDERKHFTDLLTGASLRKCFKK